MGIKPKQYFYTIFAATTLAALLVCNTASAALFLKFDDVAGESQDDKHKNWIDILSVNWGISVAVTGTGPDRKLGGPVFSDLNWTQTQDKSFPTLFSNISSGKNIPTAEVDFSTEGKGARVYFKLKFENVLLTSLNLSADAVGKPDIAGSFMYDKVTVTFTPQDEEGKELSPIGAAYDLVKNTGDASAVADLFAQGLSGPTVSTVPLPAGI